VAGCQGQVFREIVAELLQRRDALKTSPDDIIFFDDSTLATTCALELLGGDGGAVLVPFPGFPST
jgi:aspartate/methionine/tyrosine aminotransferase